MHAVSSLSFQGLQDVLNSKHWPLGSWLLPSTARHFLSFSSSLAHQIQFLPPTPIPDTPQFLKSSSSITCCREICLLFPAKILHWPASWVRHGRGGARQAVRSAHAAGGQAQSAAAQCQESLRLFLLNCHSDWALLLVDHTAEQVEVSI